MSIARGQRSAALDPALGANPLGFALGDLRLGAKVAFLPRGSAFNAGASLTVGLPTGDTATLRGGGAVVVSPRLLGELDLRVLRLLANAGVTLRTVETRLLDLRVGQEFVWALGAEVPVYGDSNRLSLILSATGAVGLGAVSPASVPVDAMGGLKALLGDSVALELAVGGGLTRGWATPRFQAVLGVSFIARPLPVPERWVEAAPAPVKPAPEGFAAAAPAAVDAAPAPAPAPGPHAPAFADADHDGVADAADRCPGEKETINGAADGDGCPDEGEGLVGFSGGALKLKVPVTFNRGRASPTAGASALLEQLALTLKARPSLRLRLDVYVTELPTRDENVALAAQRARALSAFFEARGVDPAVQVDVRALGMQRPFDPSSVDVSAF
jgi:outer membrane protein OmpA-like peptidoglycan-associated protein